MNEKRTTTMSALVLAVPPVAATLAVLTFSGLEIAGHTPSSYGPVRNVAEAAALGAASEVVRLLARGEDPNRLWPVRDEIISSAVTRVTGLEAAIWSRRVQLVQLLDRRGMIVTDDTRRHLACLASDLGVQEIVDYLAPGEGATCSPGSTLKLLVERSQQSRAMMRAF